LCPCVCAGCRPLELDGLDGSFSDPIVGAAVPTVGSFMTGPAETQMTGRRLWLDQPTSAGKFSAKSASLVPSISESSVLGALLIKSAGRRMRGACIVTISLLLPRQVDGTHLQLIEASILLHTLAVSHRRKSNQQRSRRARFTRRGRFTVSENSSVGGKSCGCPSPLRR
jgi:hypothetical protein